MIDVYREHSIIDSCVMNGRRKTADTRPIASECGVRVSFGMKRHRQPTTGYRLLINDYHLTRQPIVKMGPLKSKPAFFLLKSY